ncbi:MAG TPA: OmpA family protein [Methylibium sp.]
MSMRLYIAQLTLALAAGSAMAQDVRLYGANEAVDPRDVVQILDQPSTGAPVIKMRSLRLLDDNAAPQTAGVAAASMVAAGAMPARALALPVQFAFDSAEILPAARAQLDALAAGIRLLPANRAVIIEGHTDAAGSPRYNGLLSQRRAYSVKHYLVAMHGIDPGRLQAVGLGMQMPLPGRDPYAPENRRVQFRGD